MEIIKIRKHFSPVGTVVLGSYDNELCLCDWVSETRRAVIDRRICRCLGARYVEGTSEVIQEASLQLDEYFAGCRRRFALPIRFAGSEFQCRVWTEVLKIPYGSTVSYAAIASGAGMPRAIRAVASAIGANALSVIVPCHRVTGSDGGLTGYAGGLKAKRMLLDLEARCLRSTSTADYFNT